MKKRRVWIQMLGGSVAMLLLALCLWPRQVSVTEQAGMEALEKAREEWMKGQLLSEEMLHCLSERLALHPALHGRYDGLLAQAYLLHPNAVRSIEYLNRIQTRLGERLGPLPSTFITTTTLIAQNAYVEAYQEAKQLEGELSAQGTYPWLRLMNLLRLTALARALDDPEYSYWASRLQMQPNYRQLATLFQEGDWHWNPNST